MSTRTATDDLTAELFAVEVAHSLGTIARAQHRIACALASEHRQAVIRHLRTLGISEESAQAYAGEALSREQIQRVSELLTAVQGWRPHLAGKVRAIAVADK